MTTSSSSVPILGPVLYFTQTDGYSYDVDNRPLANLDTNIRHINTSLVGIGYGEHATLSGGQLSPGTIVSLAPNGAVFYPLVVPSSNPTENIVGLVIGATDTGLNRVIWSSKHLDLDVLGLTSITAGIASGSYIVTTGGSSGAPIIRTAPQATDYILGIVKSGPYIEINTASELIANTTSTTVNNAVLDNHANMYGLTRFRNLLLYIDSGSTPTQYIKKTTRQSDYFAAHASYNPLNAYLSSNLSTIAAIPTSDSTVYGGIDHFGDKVLKESYTQFVTATSTDSVVCGTATSTWSSVVHGKTLPYYQSQNYELQQLPVSVVAGAVDYSSNVSLFNGFQVDKYYQYQKTSVAPLAGQLSATATVFNPLNIDQLGGEPTRLIVWDFYTYDINGLEKYKYRVILNGDASEQAFENTNIFPAALKSI